MSKINMEPSSSLLSNCQIQNPVSPGIQPEDINKKPGETYTDQERGNRGREQKIADLVGQLEAMSKSVMERGGRPTPEEVHKARSLIGQLKGLGFRPRQIGLSMRQLGLNPGPTRKPHREPTREQIHEWQIKLQRCTDRRGSLTDWERQFIDSLDQNLDHGWLNLSEKQAVCLRQIYAKVREARHG